MDFSEVDLSSLHNLTYLDVSSTLFASFSIVPSTVTTLIADNCTELWDIPSTGFADVSSQIEVLSLVSVGLYDISPFYSSSSLTSLDISSNPVCADPNIASLNSLFDNPSSIEVISDALTCPCDSFPSMDITDNYVCAPTYPGSNTYYPQCSCDTFYDDDNSLHIIYWNVSEFTCIRNDDSCSGGCEYGYMCSGASGCRRIVPSENTHNCVYDHLLELEDVHYDPSENFSVASLKVLTELDCSNKSITDVTDINHAINVTSMLFYDNENLNAIYPLCNASVEILDVHSTNANTYGFNFETEQQLEILNLSNTNYGNLELNQSVPTYLGGLSNFHKLKELYVGDNPYLLSVTPIYGTIETLEILDIHNTGITDLSSFYTISSGGALGNAVLSTLNMSTTIIDMSGLQYFTGITHLEAQNSSILNEDLYYLRNNSLEYLDLGPDDEGNNSNFIYDPSPLYIHPLTDINLVGQPICGDSVSDDLLTMLNVDITASHSIYFSLPAGFTCPCSSSETLSYDLLSNRICTPSTLTSGSWNVVCASNSFSVYSYSDDYECVYLDESDDSNIGCPGGCLYGEECRLNSDGIAQCMTVLSDPEFHGCIASQLDSADKDGDSFSVSSLKTISGSELRCEDMSIANIDGIEHFTSVTSIYMENNSITDVSPIKTMDNLTFVDFTLNSITVTPQLGDMSNLETLIFIDNPSLSFSNSFDPDALFPSSLKSLKIEGTLIDNDGFNQHIASRLSSLLEINIANSNVTDISGLSETQISTITKVNAGDNTLDSGFIATLSSMTNLEYLSVSNCNLTELFDLSNSASTLSELYICDNDIYFLDCISEMSALTKIDASGCSLASTLSELYICDNDIYFLDCISEMSALTKIDASGCSLSDISPLYSLPNLSRLLLDGNNICLGSETSSAFDSKFTGNVDISLESLECNCDMTSIAAITDNKICVEPKPGAGSWTIVCASNSYTYYNSSPDFVCYDTNVNQSNALSCPKGCQYGEECRLDANSGVTSCYPVIVDPDLRLYIATDLVRSEFVGGTSSSPIITVAALHSVGSSEVVDGVFPTLSDISGIEHLINVTELNICGSSVLSDVSGLSSMKQLVTLNLSENNISNVSAIASFNFTDLQSLNLSNCPLDSSVSQLYQLSTLQTLDISGEHTGSINIELYGTGLTQIESLNLSGWEQLIQLPSFSSSNILKYLNVSDTGLENLDTLSNQSSSLQLIQLPSFSSSNILKYLNVSDTGLENLDTLSNQSSSLVTIIMDGCDLSAGSCLFSSFSNLSSLSINSTNYPISSLSCFSSNSLLTSFSGDSNGWYHLYGFSNQLAQLTDLSLKSNYIGDPSPLYLLNSLTSLDLSYNTICGTDTDIISKFTSLSSLVLTQEEGWECPCDESEVSILDNKVCVETYPSSGTFFVECTSGSYYSYDANQGFTCTDDSVYCPGGCAFGEECYRATYVPCDQYSLCQSVVPDANLKAYLLSQIPSIHVSPSGDFRPSVLRLIEEIHCSSCDIDSIVGLKHAISSLVIDVSSNNLIYARDFGFLTQLIKLDLSNNSSIIDAGWNLANQEYDFEELNFSNVGFGTASTITDIIPSYSASYPHLKRFDLSNNTGLSACSGCGEFFDLLEWLDISNTSITDLSYIVINPTTEEVENNTALKYLNITNLSLTDYSFLENLYQLEEFVAQNSHLTSYHLPLLRNSSLSSLDLGLNSESVNNNRISDPSPLYMHPLTSVVLDGNMICEDDSVIVSNIISKINNNSSSVTVSASTQNCQCSDLSSSGGWILSDVVCMETIPYSDEWNTVCSSHSITEYSSAEVYECVTIGGVSGDSMSCDGGCVFGNECRYDSTLGSSQCEAVIYDENLRDFIASYMLTSAHKYNNPTIFSVSSLRTVNDTELVYNGNTQAEMISSIVGIEHLVSLETVYVLNNTHLESAVSLAHLTNLTLVNVESTAISDISFICTLPNLINLSFSSLEVDNLPSCSSPTAYSNLIGLDISQTGIIDLSPLLIHEAGTKNNLIQQLFLDTNNQSIDGEVVYFDPSQLINFPNISMLSVSSMHINESLFGYIMDLGLIYLDISDNYLYDISPLVNFIDLSNILAHTNYICDPTSILNTSYFSALTNVTYGNQDTSHCLICNSTTPMTYLGNPIVHFDGSGTASYSNNTVCRKVWDWEVEETDNTITQHEQWSVQCNLYSFKSSSGTCESYFASSPVDPIPPCFDDATANVHMECSTVTSDTACLDGWYGDSCDSECLLDDNDVVCGDPSRCNLATHECACGSDLFGDVLTCTVDNDVPVSEMANIEELDISDISSSTLSSLGGLKFASNLTSFTAKNISFTETSTPLNEFSDLELLESIVIEGIAVTSYSQLPSSLLQLDISDDESFDSAVLETIPSDLTLDSLTLMNLSVNDISYLSNFSDSLKSLKLRSLKLKYISVIEESLFSLTSLDLTSINLFDDPSDTSSTPSSHYLNQDDCAALDWTVLSDLKILSINGNNISSLTWLGNPSTGLYDQLTSLDVSDNIFLSDVSPLFQFSKLSLLDISGNSVHLGIPQSSSTTLEDFKSLFPSDSLIQNSTSIVLTPQIERCSDLTSITALVQNKVCSETKRGSNTWHTTCASDSYTTYSSASEFTCTRPDALSTNCSGGCEYGYECRSISAEPAQGSCVRVIEDSTLHSCIASLFTDTTHRTDDNDFSVSSLKLLGTDSFASTVTCVGDGTNQVSDLAGVEHVVMVTSLDLQSNSIADAALLETLSSLQTIDLSNNSALEEMPELGGLVSLSTLDLDSTGISLPTGTNTDVLLPVSSLSNLNLHGTNITQTEFDAHVAANLHVLTSLDVGYTNVTDLSQLNSDLLESLEELKLEGNSLSADSYPVLANMSQLESLSLINCDLTKIPNLYNSRTTLTKLVLSNNANINVLESILTYELSSLQFLDLSHCSVSDVSPLYPLSALTDLDVSYNKICTGSGTASTLASHFDSDSSLSINLSDQSCPLGCSTLPTDTDLFESNKVCIETVPGSSKWFPVCTSDSYTTYSSASEFTCTRPSDPSSCSGGCEYGSHALVPMPCPPTVPPAQGSCVRVIEDSTLHSCIASLFTDTTHRTDDNDFSVSSLKLLGTDSFASTVTCVGDGTNQVSDLAGIEHVVMVTSLDLQSNSITDAALLETLSSLQTIDLSNNSALEEMPELGGLVSLATLDLGSTGISLPTGTNTDVLLPVSSLSNLNLHGTKITQTEFDAHVAANLHVLTSLDVGYTNVTDLSQLNSDLLESLEELKLEGNSLSADSYPVLANMTQLESLSLIDCDLTKIPNLYNSRTTLTKLVLSNNANINVLESILTYELSSLQFLDLSHCSVSDVSPLYPLSALTDLDVSYNKICTGSGTASTLASHFASDSSLSINLSDQSCPLGCSTLPTDTDLFEANKVCIETVPGSSKWFPVCTSDSYTTYSSASEFTCTRPSDPSSCSGGCEYGYECRLGVSSYECLPVIADDVLHACVIDKLDATDQTDGEFGIASMKALSVLECAGVTPVPSLILCIEVVNISDTGLGSSYGKPSITRLSSTFVCKWTELQSLDISYNPGLLSLGDISCITDVLKTLNLDSSGISDLSPLYHDDVSGEDSTNAVLSSLTISNLTLSDSSQLGNLTGLSTFVAQNASIDSFDLHMLSGLSALEYIDFGPNTSSDNNNKISDPSPLYKLEHVSYIDLRLNPICGSTEDVVTTIASGLGNAPTVKFDLSSSWVCSCTYGGLEPQLSDDRVCSETKRGSNTWHTTCASDSYTTYSSASEFTCTRPDALSTNCSGGCEYGYECRSISAEPAQGSCARVIEDNTLHSCIASLFTDTTHRTDDNDFSVSQLGNLTGLSIFIAQNASIDSFDLHMLSGLSALEHIDFGPNTSSDNNNKISDPSPLYKLEHVSYIDLRLNPICGSTEDVVTTIASGLGNAPTVKFDLSSSWVCSCTYGGLEPQLSDDRVCSETKRGSNTWHTTCASDSYTTYSSASEFTCTRPDALSTNCSGGCEYGYECRSISAEPAQGSCARVIEDNTLHSCIASLFTDTTHRTDDNDFSVSSLKELGVENLECDGVDISSFVGLESLTSLSSVNFACSSSVDVSFTLSYLSSISWLRSIDVSNCTSLSLSSYLGEFSELIELRVSNCNLTTMPNLSSSLEILDISNNSLESLDFILSSSLSSLVQFIANNNLIWNPFPLYEAKDSLCYANLSENYICDFTEDNINAFAQNFYPSECSDSIPQGFDFTSQASCDCSGSNVSENKVCGKDADENGDETYDIVCPAGTYRKADSSSLSSLVQFIANNNLIWNPFPLYEAKDSLCYANLSENYICDFTEDNINAFAQNFYPSECSDSIPQGFDFTSQASCDCSGSNVSENKVCGKDADENGDETYDIVCPAGTYRKADSSSSDGYICVFIDSSDDDLVDFCLECNSNIFTQCSYSVITDDIECACRDGWFGEYCDSYCPVFIEDGQEYACGNGSSSFHGTCNATAHQCECELGWSGDNCGIDSCYADTVECSGNGSCSQLSDTSSACSCNIGYGGELCSELLCSQNEDGELCSGNGNCEKDQFGEYYCSCYNGYIANLDNSDCLSMCSEGYCINGECIGDECLCDSGFSGSRCEEYSCSDSASDEEVCNNHGECVRFDLSSHQCVCELGWNGSTCKDEGCPYDGNSVQCGEHGTCVSDSDVSECLCDDGWTFSELGVCEEKVGTCADDSDCSSNGTCVFNSDESHWECSCYDGWSGETCINDVCSPACDASSHSYEIAFQCVLKDIASMVNVLVMTSDEEVCNNHGECVRFDLSSHQCVCELGWNGSTCKDEGCPYDGNSVQCGEHGTCVSDSDVSECLCDDGWTFSELGVCEEKVGTCADDSDCSSNGTCVFNSDESHWECSCYDGWSGETCINDVCSPACDASSHSYGCSDLNGDGSLVCECKQGWSGSDCSEMSCNCNGKGECVEESDGSVICECIDGWYGESCNEIDSLNSETIDDEIIVPYTDWSDSLLFKSSPLFALHRNQNITIHDVSIFESFPLPYQKLSELAVEFMFVPFVIVDFEIQDSSGIPQEFISDGSIFRLFQDESDSCVFVFCYDSVYQDSTLESLDSIQCSKYSLPYCNGSLSPYNRNEMTSFYSRHLGTIRPSIKLIHNSISKHVGVLQNSFPVHSRIHASSARLLASYSIPHCSLDINGAITRVFGNLLVQCVCSEENSCSWRKSIYHDSVSVILTTTETEDSIEYDSNGIYVSSDEDGSIVTTPSSVTYSIAIYV
ncbi:hypothetical protein ADUPG1_008282, partial [Aduncisulcus paluster]